ncbi:thiamine pyrophosphate-dependent enzyme [Actinophytocola sp.]|uniref:thiamine pyrophosphate-dependent enzyme n=1 Tax=Actinophytocola sp. TaxID=1872138 RepID=UPI002EDB7E6E
MSFNVSDLIVETLKNAGVRRVYGLPGDSLNGFTDALRRDGALSWGHVRHEEAAAFAAAGDAATTGGLAVCAASCGPGDLRLINGLSDAHRSRVPVLAIAAHAPSNEIGGNRVRETHPEELFRECSVYCELASAATQFPYVLDIAVRTAVEKRGVAVLVVPGDVLLAEIQRPATVSTIRPASLVGRPGGAELRRAAEVLNRSERVTILAAAGCAGAPGFSSGHHAMEQCDTLLMLGTDFPVKDTIEALLPTLRTKTDSTHLDRTHHATAPERLDERPVNDRARTPTHPRFVVTTVNELASEGAVFLADVGSPLIWAARYLQLTGRRRLIGPFDHDTMANAIPRAIGVQSAQPSQQVITFSGDGELAMMVGELVTLQQLGLPVKIVLFNGGALSCDELEMKAAGPVDHGTDLDNANFAAVARALGMHGQRVARPDELSAALRAAFDHDGAALVEVMTARQELSMPPTITVEQVENVTIDATRTGLSGRGDELIDLATTNVTRRIFS